MSFIKAIQTRYNLSLVKLKLLGNMILAANTGAIAIYLCFLYLIKTEVDYGFCLGSFLILRVYLFMANKQMPLTDENVAFMSSERTLWNLATICVSLVMAILIHVIERFN